MPSLIITIVFLLLGIALIWRYASSRYTLPIARLVGPRGRVVAIDIQQKMLDTVGARAKALGLENVSCRKTPLGEGAFQNKNIFDRAFLTTVLGEIPKQAQGQAMQEIYAALKPGGISSVAEIMLDPHYQSPSRVRQLAEQAGFQFERRSGNRFNFIAHFIKPE